MSICLLMSRIAFRTPKLRSLGSDDRGMTLLELSVAMLISALIATAMLSWIIGVASADDRFKSNDLALGDLRDVSDRLSRELRSSEYVTAAQSAAISFWADSNRDDVIDAGETITWTLESDGSVVRTTDAGLTTVVATRLDPDLSSFSYDEPVPADVATVTIELVALSPSGDTNDELRYASKVFLRNS